MIDILVAVLILCFAVGVISSALFVASFYLYRESHRATAAAAADASAGADQEQTKLRQLDQAAGPHGECSADASLHACHVCGSVCAPGGRLRLSEGDIAAASSEHCQPPYRCGELFISGVDVGFKSHTSGGLGAPSFFFYRGRQASELMERVKPSDNYLTIAALPSVPYHLWFCPTEHQARSHRCQHCRPVFSFQLGHSEVLFTNTAAGETADGSVTRMTDVWLLACQEGASLETQNSVIYRGNIQNVTRLPYTGKLLLYFGLSDMDMKSFRLEGASPATACDADENLTHGDLLAKMKKQTVVTRSSRQILGYRRDNPDVDSTSSDSDETNSSMASMKSERSVISLGSMRKAAKWPITQIESLMESSTSSDEQRQAELSQKTGADAVEAEAVDVELEVDSKAKPQKEQHQPVGRAGDNVVIHISNDQAEVETNGNDADTKKTCGN